MSETTSHAHSLATGFLDMLASEGPPGGFLELRYRLADGERMGQVFERPTRVSGLATRAIALGRRTDVYVGCAPRARRLGGREAVVGGSVLWADCDGARSASALERFDPAPPVVLASGSGPNRHAFWPLARPLPRDDLERANRRLAHALGADLSCADAARILRVPGTYSHKHSPPVPVLALRADVDRRLRAADVVGDLPDPLGKPQPPRGRIRLRAVPQDPLLGIEPAVYVARLLCVEVPSDRKVSCPFHPDEHPSLHVYDSPARGWFCFGRCRRGGTIYDLAAPLYGYEPRGSGFLRLRAELLRLFGMAR